MHALILHKEYSSNHSVRECHYMWISSNINKNTFVKTCIYLSNISDSTSIFWNNIWIFSVTINDTILVDIEKIYTTHPCPDPNHVSSLQSTQLEALVYKSTATISLDLLSAESSNKEDIASSNVILTSSSAKLFKTDLLSDVKSTPYTELLTLPIAVSHTALGAIDPALSSTAPVSISTTESRESSVAFSHTAFGAIDPALSSTSSVSISTTEHIESSVASHTVITYSSSSIVTTYSSTEFPVTSQSSSILSSDIILGNGNLISNVTTTYPSTHWVYEQTSTWNQTYQDQSTVGTDGSSVVAFSSSSSELITMSSAVTRSTTSENMCLCECSRHSMENIDNILTEIKKNLTIEIETLSSYKRKYISVGDSRLSAGTMGYCAAVILLIVPLLIILSDLSNLFNMLRV